MAARIDTTFREAGMIVGSKNLISLHPDELEWQDDTEVFTLPEGVQVKMFSHDPQTGRREG